MPKMFICSACGKDLHAAVKLLGEQDVVAAHVRAHQRDDLNVVREAIENAWLSARSELAEAQEHYSLSILTAHCKKALDDVSRVIDQGKTITFSKE